MTASIQRRSTDMQHNGLDQTALAVGRMDEFMVHTRGTLAGFRESLADVEAAQKELKLLIQHNRLSDHAVAQDVGEVKSAMKELYTCIREEKDKRAGRNVNLKSVAIGAMATVVSVAFVTILLAGADGDLLTTLSLIMGVLL